MNAPQCPVVKIAVSSTRQMSQQAPRNFANSLRVVVNRCPLILLGAAGYREASSAAGRAAARCTSRAHLRRPIQQRGLFSCDVDRLVAEQPTDRRPDREPHTLHPGRWERQAHRVEGCVRDDGQAQGVWHPLPVRLALGGEGEHRLDELFELQRRTHLARETGFLLARVPETVGGPRRDGEPLSGTRDELLPSEPKAYRTPEDLETLFLMGVDVGRRHEAARFDERLQDDGLAARVARGLTEEKPLSG